MLIVSENGDYDELEKVKKTKNSQKRFVIYVKRNL